jgi:hypothetical protein
MKSRRDMLKAAALGSFAPFLAHIRADVQAPQSMIRESPWWISGLSRNHKSSAIGTGDQIVCHRVADEAFGFRIHGQH